MDAGGRGVPSKTCGFFPTASEYFLGWAICEAASWKIEGVFMICSNTFCDCSRVVATVVAAKVVVATVEVLVAMTT